MRRTRTWCKCVSVVLFLAGLGLAQDGGVAPPQPVSRIIYVDQCCLCEDGDGLSPNRAMGSIQAGIDLAQHGDRVLVYPVTYKESLDLKGKAITQGSSGGRGGGGR